MNIYANHLRKALFNNSIFAIKYTFFLPVVNISIIGTFINSTWFPHSINGSSFGTFSFPITFTLNTILYSTHSMLLTISLCIIFDRGSFLVTFNFSIVFSCFVFFGHGAPCPYRFCFIIFIFLRVDRGIDPYIFYFIIFFFILVGRGVDSYRFFLVFYIIMVFITIYMYLFIPIILYIVIHFYNSYVLYVTKIKMTLYSKCTLRIKCLFYYRLYLSCLLIFIPGILIFKCIYNRIYSTNYNKPSSWHSCKKNHIYKIKY